MSPPDPLIGVTAGGYRVLSLLSIGGMGSVYRAEHLLIGRPAAIKVLLPEMSTNHDMVQRFFNEAKATTAIHHPGIVEVFDFGYLPSGQAYIVMELLDGMTLAQRVRAQGRMHEGEAAMILRSACGALAAAHAAGVVHRDLKPDNIFLVADADAPIGVRCKLLDFGIAKLTAVGAVTSATKTGAVMGTPTYMSPEQCKGSGEVDARADLYSLGCIFYELVTGRPPFVCDGAGELLGSHLFVEPEPPSRHAPGITPDGDALIMQLLAKLPARRVQTARELAARVSALATAHGWAPSSTDLDSRMSMASISFGAVDESTQLAPLPTPVPAAMTVPRKAPPEEPTAVGEPIVLPDEAPMQARVPTPMPMAPARTPMPMAPVRTPMPMQAHVPTPMPMQAHVPTPMPMQAHVPTPMPMQAHVPTPMPMQAHVPTPMPMQAHVPTPMPMGAYVPTPMPPIQTYVPTPTTLSGAARQAQEMAPGARPARSRAKLALAFGVAGIAVGVIVFLAVGRDTPSAPPAAAPPPIVPVAVPADAAPPPPPPDAALAIHLPDDVVDAAPASVPPADAATVTPDATEPPADATRAVDAGARPDDAGARPADAGARPDASAAHPTPHPHPVTPHPHPTDDLLEPKL